LRIEPRCRREASIQRRTRDSEYGHLNERVCSNPERRWLVGGRAVVHVGCNYGKRSPRFKAASLDRRCSWVFHGHRVRHLRSGYGHSRELSGWCRDLRCGSLLRNFADRALVASENFGVGTSDRMKAADAYRDDWRKIPITLIDRTGPFSMSDNA
jgi:hypothetical protein